MANKIPTYEQLLNSLSIVKQYVDNSTAGLAEAVENLQITDTQLNDLIARIFVVEDDE